MERALPNAAIKARMTALAVGLAADCDAPEEIVEKLMNEKLAGATGLPFVAFLTPDGTWIEGYSGWKEEADLLAVIGRVEKSPLLDATPVVRKQLEKAATAATAAAVKADWKPVLDAARQASKTTGRCPERVAIATAEQAARAWANEQLDAAAAEARSGKDMASARKRLAEVKKHFAGEPESLDADTGGKAMLRLTQIRDVEALPNPKKDLREKAAATFEKTRWAAIFAKADGEK